MNHRTRRVLRIAFIVFGSLAAVSGLIGSVGHTVLWFAHGVPESPGIAIRAGWIYGALASVCFVAAHRLRGTPTAPSGRRQWVKRIATACVVFVIVFAGVPAVIAAKFARTNTASAVATAVTWARLAPLPPSAQNLHVDVKGSMLTREFVV
jgi:hypothetical protein